MIYDDTAVLCIGVDGCSNCVGAKVDGVTTCVTNGLVCIDTVTPEKVKRGEISNKL